MNLARSFQYSTTTPSRSCSGSIPIFSVPPDKKCVGNDPLISNPQPLRDGPSLPQLTDNLSQPDNEAQTFSLYDFSGTAPIQNVDMTSNTGYENHLERTDWLQCLEEMISGDDATDTTWNNYLVYDDSQNPDQKMLNPSSEFTRQQVVVHQDQPSQAEEPAAVAPLVTNTAPTNTRMRWTQEFHEKFLEAVNVLGGCERATPSKVQKLMNVPGLKIPHIKSHLQKTRTAMYKAETSEGPSGKRSSSPEDIESLDMGTRTGITKALRLQMQLQKHLHEQLEKLRKLQVKIEENGRYIERILDKQEKIEDEASPSNVLKPSQPDSEQIYLKSGADSLGCEEEEKNG